MKIVFVHSCLESGRDGVGDYTRLLAQEFQQQGNECSLIALNDKWVSETSLSQNTGNGITELRLPNTLPWPERISQAHSHLVAFDPKWVSLQFVPYGWHTKGIVKGLGPHLQQIVAGRRVHMMFHELWLGDSQTSSLKHRLIGAVQKHFVRQVVRKIQPKAIHTSNYAYVELLRLAGLPAQRLPLFSGIRVMQANADTWLFTELQRIGLDISPVNRSEFWLTGFFGSLPAGWPSEPLFSRLSKAATQHKRHVVILSVGRIGTGEAIWNDLAQQYSSQFAFCHLGPQSEEHVSQYLNSLDFGLAAAPYTLIGKSSATAAMLDHGLPVIVSRNDVRYSFDSKLKENFEPLLHRVEDLKPSEFRGYLKRGLIQSRLPAVAEQLIRDLTSSELRNN